MDDDDQDSSVDVSEDEQEGSQRGAWKTVHKRAKSRFERYLEALSEVRKAYKDDVEFALFGKQWDDGIKSWRKERNRQSLVYNQLGPLVRHAANKIRRSTSSIKIHPNGLGANKDTAQVLDGMLKRVQTSSYAPQVYAHAYICKLAGGLGWWRVLPKEVRRRGTTRREILIERIRDPLSVVYNPYFEQIDGSDMEDLFYLFVVSKTRFNRDYKGKTASSFSDEIECDADSVVLAEYWTREPGEDGSDQVVQYILSGDAVLWCSTGEDGTKYGGSYIPFAGIWGEEVHLGNKTEYKSLGRDVKDVQKLVNYSKSEAADRMAKAFRGQYMLDMRNIEDPKLATRWNAPNADGAFFLPILGKDGVPLPQFVPPPPPPAGDQEMAREAISDLRAMVGIANPIEDVPATQSGKAISLQQDERDLMLYGFVDGLHVAQKYTGKIIVDLFQAYMIQPEEITVEGRDGQLSSIKINEPYTENGQAVLHDLQTGDYTVEFDVGPSWRDGREEAKEAMGGLLSGPMGEKVAMVAPDVVANLMDFDGSDVLEKRLRATVPPNILAASNPTNADQVGQQAAQLQQVAQQQHQLIQQQHEEIQAAQQEIGRLKAANDTKLQISRDGNTTQLQLETMRGQIDVLLKRMENAHDAAMIDHHPGANLQVIT